MGESGFPDPGDIFEQKVAAGQQADDRHLDDMGFPLNNQCNIVLDSPDRLRRVHVWIIGSGGLEIDGDMTPLKSSKGSEDGQFICGFSPVTVEGWQQVFLAGWHEHDHPRGRFFNHVAKFPGRAAGRHVGEDGSSPHLYRTEAIGG